MLTRIAQKSSGNLPQLASKIQTAVLTKCVASIRLYNSYQGDEQRMRTRPDNRGPRQDFRQGRMNNNRPTLNNRFNEAPEARGALLDPYRNDPEMFQFKRALLDKRIYSAFDAYERLCQTRFEDLEFLDHVKLMALFKDTSLTSNLQKLAIIFENLEKGRFSIPSAIYETMVTKMGNLGSEKVNFYINKVCKDLGEKSLTVPMYAALMNAYRREGQMEQALKVYDEVSKRPHLKAHSLLPIVMNIHMSQKNETAALEVFNEFISQEEVGPLNLAKAYGWLASSYVEMNRLDDAENVLNKLEERGIRLHISGYGVLAQIALKRGDYEKALEHAQREMEDSNRDIFGNTVNALLKEFMAVHRPDLIERVLELYRQQYSRIPGMRFNPFISCIEYYSQQNNVGSARQVFDLIPSKARFRNIRLVRSIMNVYIQENRFDKAQALLDEAMQSGLRSEELQAELMEAQSKNAKTNEVPNAEPKADEI